MKKVFLFIFSCVLFSNFLNAQDKLGIDTSFLIPLSESGKVTTLGLGGSVMYYNALNDDETIFFGPSLGLDIYFSETYIFMPAAASMMFVLEDKSKISVDLGYALGLVPSVKNSGLHYKIGFSWGMARMTYSSINFNGINFSSLQFGAVVLID